MTTDETRIWPNDVVRNPAELSRESPHKLVCFLLSPFVPREVFDKVHDAVSTACRLCASSAGIDIECRRADTLVESKMIHDDIWRHIASSDFLVIDTTGLNPNVMIEFGVAASLRRPGQVILIKDADDLTKLPFNAFAQRCFIYSKSITGDQDFISRLSNAMINAITPAPYLPSINDNEDQSRTIRIDFKDGDRSDLVLSPGITHRRLTEDSLEYGSYYVFRNSWLLLTNKEYRNVRARLVFRFISLAKEPKDAFLGISLRNQHFFANWGHMVLLRADGRLLRTEPENELGGYHDVEMGSIAGFDHKASDFIDLEVQINEEYLTYKAGALAGKVELAHIPYVFGAGKVRVSVAACRVLIKTVELEKF